MLYTNSLSFRLRVRQDATKSILIFVGQVLALLDDSGCVLSFESESSELRRDSGAALEEVPRRILNSARSIYYSYS